MSSKGMARVTDEPSRVYQHFRAVFGDRRPRQRGPLSDDQRPFTPGRDPQPLAGAMAKLSADMGWTTQMAEATLVLDWPTVVGEHIADHTEVVSMENGVLTVACDSSAWATQLRLMRHDLLVRLSEIVPDASVESIVVRAPGAPSWRKGSRSVPGRGPRDTYG